MALDSEFWKAESQRMYELIYPVMFDAALDAATRASGTIGLDISFELVNEVARDWASQYTFALVRNVNGTTERFLQKAVADWIENRSSLDVLIETLAPMFGPVRASMIAVTEVTRAYSEGNRLAWRSSGVVQHYEFRTAQDDIVCPVCGPEEGKQYAIDDSSHAPPLHVNCRCWLQPVVEA